MIAVMMACDGGYKVDVYVSRVTLDAGELPGWSCQYRGTKAQVRGLLELQFAGDEIEYIDAATGACAECAEYHYELEWECGECGAAVDAL